MASCTLPEIPSVWKQSLSSIRTSRRKSARAPRWSPWTSPARRSTRPQVGQPEKSIKCGKSKQRYDDFIFQAFILNIYNWTFTWNFHFITFTSCWSFITDFSANSARASACTVSNHYHHSPRQMIYRHRRRHHHHNHKTVTILTIIILLMKLLMLCRLPASITSVHKHHNIIIIAISCFNFAVSVLICSL